ncbi:MAG TPA: CHASE2 domain-containing protein, partial [Micropepsaceae bacterium]
MTESTNSDAGLSSSARITRARVVIWVLCLLIILAAGIVPQGFFEISSNSVFDAYQQFSPSRVLPSPTILVDVDDESLRRVGQWPWRRDQIAQMIDAAAGARVVGLDILLTEQDRLSPKALLSDLPNIPPEIVQALSALPQSDAVLAKSLSRVPVVLAAAARTAGDDPSRAPVAMAPIFETGVDPRPAMPRYRSVAWPLPELVAASRGIGLVSEVSESDGVTRRMSVLLAIGPVLMPSFAAEVVRVASNAPRIVLLSGPAGGRELQIGDHRVALDTAGRVWPHLGKRPEGESVPAYRLIDGSIPPSFFRDRIVLMGVGASGLGNVSVTPLRQTEPPMAIQAHLIDSLMSGDVLWRPPMVKSMEVLFALALAAAALLLMGRISDLAYGILFGAIALVSIIGSFV